MKNIEILSVNDCSTDNSLLILKKILQKVKRIKIINNDRNHGLLYSRGIGILNSSRAYVLNLDDMVSNENNLEILYNTAKRFKSSLIILRLREFIGIKMIIIIQLVILIIRFLLLIQIILLKNGKFIT